MPVSIGANGFHTTGASMDDGSRGLERALALLAAAAEAKRRSRKREPDRMLTAVLADLASARAAAGFTQEDVAERMRTTKSAISRLERGMRTRPALQTLEKYARAVGAVLEIRVRRR